MCALARKEVTAILGLSYSKQVFKQQKKYNTTYKNCVEILHSLINCSHRTPNVNYIFYTNSNDYYFLTLVEIAVGGIRVHGAIAVYRQVVSLLWAFDVKSQKTKFYGISCMLILECG